MSGFDSRTRRESAQAIGPGRQAVIRAIAQGVRHRTKLVTCCASVAKGKPFDAMLARMVEDGLIIAQPGDRYALTEKARELLEPAPAAAATPYVPPPPAWRRPGSDHSHFPSLAGGRRIYR